MRGGTLSAPGSALPRQVLPIAGRQSALEAVMRQHRPDRRTVARARSGGRPDRDRGGVARSAEPTAATIRDPARAPGR